MIDQELIDFYVNYRTKTVSNLKNFSYTLFIVVSKICNLNCSNCQTICLEQNFDLNNKNNFITLEDIKTYIPILKQKIHPPQHIILFGGEPLLNPEVKEICQYIRTEFSDIQITIFTNGLLLNNWTEEDYDLIKQLNIHFLITMYPIESSINNTKTQEEKLQKMNIPVEIHGSRISFCKSSFELNGQENYELKYYKCIHNNYPFSLYMHKNKLYKCGVVPNLYILGFQDEPEDYIDLSESFSLNDILNYFNKPLPSCKHCGKSQKDLSGNIDIFGTNETVLWHTQKEISSEYSFSLLDNYLNNYPLYYKYCHDCQRIIKVLDNQYFMSKYSDDITENETLQIYLNRFKNGIGDVMIPFDINIINNKDKLLKFKELLVQQFNYYKINFYFISIDKNKSAKYLMYRIFTPTSCDIKGNFHFLESSSLNEGIKIFQENSYLDKKIILNLNDVNLLSNLNYINNKFIES